MADPNRKINLDLPSDEEEDSSSVDEVILLNPAEISLVKEFEEEFKNRFTDSDTVFTEFCKQKPKPPPIVFPFESFHHNRSGSHQRGRFQGYGQRQGFEHRNNNYHGQNRYNHQWNRNENQASRNRSRDDYNPST